MLSSQTALLALAVDADSKKAERPKAKSSGSTLGSFHVYCKGCERVAAGKLRMYCDQCGSAAVVARKEPNGKEPNGWSDVLLSKRIPIYCADCEGEQCHARFAFKCVECQELAVILRHLRPNRDQEKCVICGEAEGESVVADLGCHHPTCLPCFEAYLVTTFEQSGFSMKPPHGYTVNCPVYGCDFWITDAHHFHLLGSEAYEKYQTNAAEKFVAMQEEGHFCPRAECGAAFMVQPWEEDDRLVLCPKCSRTFCSTCRNPERCLCGDTEDETQKAIRTISKQCPKCSVNTERNGGCSHIHCTQCGADWCFLCVKPWSDDCQWDHWFS
uniref:RBR-type E3 ubiquitin transferase n=1 Tax=Steinernema glaseri TaxID=37863 RepID=A0A1I8A4G9_9BILA